jgi:hypothetical protein
VAELVLPPGFINVHYIWTLTGDPEPMSTALAAQLNADHVITQPDVEDLADTWTDGWGLANQDPTYTYKGVKVEVGQDGDPLVFTAVRTAVGTHSTAGRMPNNCALLIRKNGALSGRRHRGRNYLPPFGVGEDNVNNLGMIDSSVMTGLQTLTTSWFVALATVGFVNHVCILHTPNPDDPEELPDVVQSFAMEQQIATQRRRMR